MQMLRYITAIAFSASLAFAQDKVSHPYYPLFVGAEWPYDIKGGSGILYKIVEKSVGDSIFYVKVTYT